jgi:hypothetical protein
MMNRAGKTQVFVSLLDEGTVVWRPVDALMLAPGVYRILGVPPEGERWQFQQGEAVICKESTTPDGGSCLIAVERARLH